MEDLAEPSLASEGSIMVVDLLKVTSAAFAESLTQDDAKGLLGSLFTINMAHNNCINLIITYLII